MRPGRSPSLLLCLAAALVACRRAPSAGKASAPPRDAAGAVAPARAPLLGGPDTFGVVAGVLSFSDPGVTAFSDELRKDRELHQLLIRRGVPEENLTLLLDAEASAASVIAALETTAARATRGSTFFFYYAGHGSRDEAGKPYFLAHDTESGKNALYLDRIGRAIDEKFAGVRVVLMADCCYSGALRETADQLSRFDALVLTSADASNTSTENWTFTQTVIDGLTGDALADANGDGSVSLGELAGEVAGAMKHREAQRHGFFARGVELSEPLAKASARPAPVPGAPFPPGAYVRVAEGEAGRAVRVREAGATESLVRYYRYNQAEDRKVKNGELTPSSFARVPVGSELRVFWGGKIWDARVLETEDDFHFITYPGWPSHWDEWILSDRIADESDLGKGTEKRVQVEWRGRWYPAVVRERRGKRYLVHYVGYESSWDEWVSAERIRL